ncbi:outer membrane protein X [Salegentibacter echinorum]|uniref:Outer membrane protein X n=1 Tax=Salegentibacter echinorum TaxID=1073325 RepID=A0A1M5CTW2_SALEC|nr:outer membrane beta-barrel protein [Salegentibacter echinorum]SHF57782.1 outer membrane protein X [Salegentibacter echinorum]
MKKQLFIFTLSIMSIGLFTKSAEAQEIDTRIGAMLAYGTEIENVGIGANAEFGVMDRLSISPSFIYYFPKSEGPIKVNWFEINGNANYYLLQDEGFQLYGLAGLNYTNVKVKYDGPTGDYGYNFSGSDGRFGLNLGAGANLNLEGNITPFAELKYVIIDDGQLVLAAGVRFRI